MSSHAAGNMELQLAAEALSLGLRCGGSALRNKTVALLAKLIHRVVASMRATLAGRHTAALNGKRRDALDAGEHLIPLAHALGRHW